MYNTTDEARSHWFGLLADIRCRNLFGLLYWEVATMFRHQCSTHLLCKRKDQDGKVKLGKSSLAIYGLILIIHNFWWGFVGACIGSIVHLPYLPINTTSVIVFSILAVPSLNLVVFTNSTTKPEAYKLTRLWKGVSVISLSLCGVLWLFSA